MRNGLVYRKDSQKILFYVPMEMEDNVIRTCHDDVGHVGVDKVYELVSRTYWFPKLKFKIKEYIRKCLKCVTYSPNSGRIEGFLNDGKKEEVPFDTIYIDHCGPIDNSTKWKKKHLFVIIDGFTKFVRLFAVGTTRTKEVIDSLQIYFETYSRPRRIVSDRGSCFTSKEFQDFIQANNVIHVKIATGSPQANGQVERVNRTVIPMLAKFSDSNDNPWYKKIGQVEFAINNTINRSTGETPSKLLFGINQRGNCNDSIREFVENEVIQDTRNLGSDRFRAVQKNKAARAYNKYNFDKKRKQSVPHQIDDYVMIKIMTQHQE